jgi:elongation factor G
MADAVEETREELIEVAAESDDGLIEKYFEEGELSSEEIQLGIQNAFRSKARIVPILCGSALENIGVQNLMDFVVECFPSPEDAGIIESEDGGMTRDAGISSPMSALVFKTLADPFAGRLTLFRVYSGVLIGDSQIFNSAKGQNEKIGKVSFMNGKHLIDTPQIVAGDFGVAIKLINAQTGDTFCDADNVIQLPSSNFPNPVISFSILPAREGDDEKLSTILQRMSEEDPTFRIERNDTTRQLLVSGLGEVHLNVIRGRMKDKFGVETAIEDPKVAYKETIRGRANGIRGRLKKQSGGRGQFGEVWINLEPTQLGESGDDEFEFVNKVVGGSIPTNYIPAVEKGIRQTRTSGVLAGYPFVDFRVTLYDGKHHPVDSSDLAFQIAGSQALRDATLDAKPVMLEPIMDVEISVPDQFMGDVIGDLNSKRGRVMGVEQVGKRQVIGATVPLSEMFRYSIDLKSITSARGSFTMDFSRYEQLPDELAQKVIADSKTDDTE